MPQRERDREPSQTSNLSLSRKEGGKHPCHRERKRLARHLTQAYLVRREGKTQTERERD